MDNWLETEPDIDDIPATPHDYKCPMCGRQKRGVEDVCGTCFRSKQYRPWVQERATGDKLKQLAERPGGRRRSGGSRG